VRAEMNRDQPTVVFKGTFLEATIIHGLLGSEGITAYLNDELMGMIAPGHVEVRVVVPADAASRALSIVKEYLRRAQFGKV
jgi:hypothetical protein